MFKLSMLSFKLNANGWRACEVAVFGALHCHPAQSLLDA